VLELLDSHELMRGDVFENREGVCRIGPSMVQRLAQLGPPLRWAIAPHGEQLARTLLAAPDHATPLTRDNHGRALASVSRLES
jgi:hypothetical protein